MTAQVLDLEACTADIAAAMGGETAQFGDLRKFGLVAETPHMTRAATAAAPAPGGM